MFAFEWRSLWGRDYIPSANGCRCGVFTRIMSAMSESNSTKIALDDLHALAIGVQVRALPENSTLSEIFPYLYEHGIAPIIDNRGQLVRIIQDIQLDEQHNPVVIEGNMDF